ncbi:pol protein integrase region [Gossypium australe]|uniref:Pol protein integrase region n=1 Tax=Gossypium australe TaxID=47621 RepID=A0A5B6VWQ7_9ROSI|nr:pol protein integrase region [Gossypium australe]
MANRMRSEREFVVGDLLSPKFVGPFQVKARIKAIAYRLTLLEGSCIHHTFYVLQLKKHIGRATASPILPFVGTNGAMNKESVRILD